MVNNTFKKNVLVFYPFLSSYLAIALCVMLFVQCTKTVRSYVEEADILVAQTQFDEAVILYQKAIQEHPKDPILYLNQAVLFRDQKKYDLALKNYHVASQLSPKNPIPFIGMTRCHLAQSHWLEAKTSAEEAVKRDPHHPTALFLLGQVSVELKEADKAIKFLNASLLAKHNALDVYYWRGRAYQDLFLDKTLAITEFENYLRVGGPKNDEIRFRLEKLK